MASVFLVSYTGMLGKAIGVNWQHQGPLGKVERLIIIMIASLLQYLTIILGIKLPLSVMSMTMLLFILLGQIAVLNRLRGMLGEIDQMEQKEKRSEDAAKVETMAVVYDSQTGNTQKVAQAIARGLGCGCYRADSLPKPINYYDLIVFGTPDHRAKPAPKILELFKQGIFPRSYALFVTFGLPVWGQITSRNLINRLNNFWKGKSLRYLGSFSCPGFHTKYKTYPGRPSQKDLDNAETFGYKLRRRRSQLSFGENLSNQIMALAIKSIGRLSQGIELSFKYGFTSGLMLDYIYQNKPNGKLVIGKWFDKLYLENPGWQVIRKRKESLKQQLKHAIDTNRQNGVATKILDIASGPARYLIETLKESGEAGIIVLCQDIDERWMEEGRRIAEQEGVKNIRYQKGDAFDLDGLASFSPNLVVSSGFYDWITDDALVKRSLGLIYEVLPVGGKIILTNQASHLSMDLVKKTFLDFTGKPLEMTTRPVELVNTWLKNASFINLVTATDNWGVYSVTTGEKA
jgi:flavodoxin/ubiquinone/menaquinone biosynthesis C-methylase UbiE